MTTSQTLAKMIRKAITRAELDALDARCTRHYEIGTISAKELARLDCMIMDKIATDETPG